MQTTRRGWSRWLTVLFWLSLIGLIGSMAGAFWSYGALQDRLADLPRTAVPGQVEVVVAGPQTLTIFYEDPTSSGIFLVQANRANTLTTSQLELTVTSPSGEAVETASYERDLRFDYEHRVLTAMATFDATSVGTYAIQVDGDVPAAAQVSVGRVVGIALIANVVGIVGLFVVSLIGLTLALVLTAVGRGRVSPSDATDRPLVGV